MCSSKGKDLGDLTRKGLDTAMGFENCIIVEDGPFRAIFLIG